MATRLATIGDYEARYGTVADSDRQKVETLLDDASALVLDAVSGSTADWVVGNARPPRLVVMVCVAAAHRALRGDDGVVREQLGEFAVTYRADDDWTIWLTPPEMRSIRKAAGLPSVGTITLVSPYSGPTCCNDLLDDSEGS